MKPREENPPRRRCTAGLVAALLCALLVACASRAPDSPPPGAPDRATTEPAVRSSLAPNPWSDHTRDLLAPHCGRCHRGDLPGAPAGALAVFDLLEDPWYGRLRPEQFDGILTRIRATGSLDPADEGAVVRFVECARDGRCDTGVAGP